MLFNSTTLPEAYRVVDYHPEVVDATSAELLTTLVGMGGSLTRLGAGAG